MADPLLDMAMRAGFFPELMQGGPITSPSQVEDGAIVSPEQGVTQPVPNSQGGTSNPAPQAQPSSLYDTVKEGVAIRSSERGFNPDKYDQVSKKEGDLERDYRLAAQEGEAQGATQEGLVVDAAGLEKLAKAKEVEAGVDMIVGKGKQASILQGLQDSFAADEAKMNMEAAAMQEQAKANYMAALADLRASRVDPGQLWGNMSAGMRFGTLVTAFVHDFLGAKGIKTSAMDTLNKAIDRNIDSQVQAIKTKGEVAEGFKSMWWMQRAQSASDAEARERVRGFLLEGTKQQIIANMSQYEAGLATAQGQAALAAIDKELATTLVNIHRHIDSNVMQLRNQALDKWKAKLQAAVQSSAIAVQRDELNWKKAQADKLSPIPQNDFLFDPETNKGRWIKKTGVKDETWAKVKDQIAGVQEVNKAIQELRDLNAELPAGFDPTQGTRLAKEDERKYEAIRLRLAHAMVKANGERATEQDVKQYLQSLPRSTWMTNGGVERILAYTQSAALAPAYESVRQYANDVPEDLQPTGAQGVPFAGRAAEADLVGKRGSVVTGPREVATQALARPDKFEPAAPDTLNKMGVGENAQDDWETFKVRNPEAFQRTVRSYDATGRVQSEGTKPYGTDKVPAGAAALTALRHQAEKGDAPALQQLNAVAFPENEGLVRFNKDEAMLMNFARLELSLYAENLGKKKAKSK